MKLIDHVLQIRYKIERAFDNRFSRMGFKSDGIDDMLDANDETKERRRHIGRIIAIHQKAGKDYKEARKEALSECVFTLYNRLAAIKVMECEDKELVPEILRTRAKTGNLSFSHNAWLEEHPEERNAERMGLKHFIRDKFAELAGRIPIYRSDYPYDLLPTADELHDIIKAFNAIDDDPDLGPDTWKGDDILGWQYENFNTAEKLALKDSGDKVEYDKVSLQSQVYTPRWTVKFLVDNSLGHLYLEMYPDSEIAVKYQIANAPKQQARAQKPLTELRIIDPACGSGNFLIYAFILLYDMYIDQIENYGAEYSRRDIPKLIIENNLYGIDLDERAVQITQIALLIKAWEIGGKRGHMPEHINVVSSHFTLPIYSEVEDAFVRKNTWDSAQKMAVESVWNDLRNAYKFGSLVRVEEKLKELHPNYDKQDLFNGQDQDNIDFRTDVAETLREQVKIVADNSSDDYSSRQVNNALIFLNIISQKYDVAVANPPYTDSAAFGIELKQFINENYSQPYKVNNNLYAVFVKRCLELTGTDGKIAMIHPLTFMYIKTFEGTRKLILDNAHINLFVEYGLSNLFGSIMVDPAFYILDKDKKNTDSTFISLDQYTRTPKEKFKKNYCLKALSDIIAGEPNKHVYSLPQYKLKEIKSWPFIYWISDEFRNKFSEFPLSKSFDVDSGFKTGNNNGALRYWWEISDLEEWSFYVKGGPFKKWYGNKWLVVDKRNDFKYIRSQNSYCITKLYEEPGVCFNGISTKGICFRLLEPETYFDMKCPAIFAKKEKNISPFLILGILNSKLIRYAVDCLDPTVSVQPNDIKRLPFFDRRTMNKKMSYDISYLSKMNVNICKYISSFEIIEPDFKNSPLKGASSIKDNLFNFYVKSNGFETLILENEKLLNDKVFYIYSLSDKDRNMVLDKEGIPVGSFSVSPEAKKAYLQWLASDDNEFKTTQDVIDHIKALEEDNNQPKVDDFDTLYQNNNGWEEFCIKHKMNPIEIWWQFINAHILPKQRTQVLTFELIADVMRKLFNNDDDGIIPLGTRIGEEHMSHRIEQELQRRGYSNAQISQIVVLLGDKDLETYLREHFFQQLSDHLNLFMYLPKTPFIWHLTSGPLHALDVMVSIYKWSRNTLTRVKSVYAARRETQLTDIVNQYTGKDDATNKLAISIARDSIKEIHDFVSKIDDLLASGYDPKLDDGVGKNIAPLQKRGMLSYDVLNSGQLKKYLNADW